MRNILAGLLLTVAALIGTLALTAHITTQTLLNPTRAGALVDVAVSTPAGQNAVLDAVAKATGHPLTPAQRSRVTHALDSPEVTAAVADSTLDRAGRLNLAGVQDALAGVLATSGNKSLARRINKNPVHVALPTQITAPYFTARHDLIIFTHWALATTIALAGAGIVISRNHASTMRRAGFAAIGAVASSMLLFRVAPALLRHFTNADVAANAWEHLGASVTAPLVGVVLAGAMLVAVSLALQIGTRVTR